MSEVKRWKLKGFLPGVEGECKAVFQPTVVMAEDFDNATRLFLDAAERCVASERREKELQRRLTAADELVCERTASLLECGTRRKALERRVDVLEGLLRDASAWIKHNSFHGTDAIELWERIDAALKPAEGGGDEA